MIFLTGPHGAGKTTGSQVLEQLGFLTIDLGPTLRRLHRESGSAHAFGEWCSEGERVHGATFTDNLLVQEVNRRYAALQGSAPSFLDLLIVGSRSLNGIRYLCNNIERASAYRDTIIYLDAHEEILRRNYSAREGVQFTPEEFERILQRDRDIGIESIRAAAEFVVRNEDSIEMLSAALEAIVFLTLKYKRRS